MSLFRIFNLGFLKKKDKTYNYISQNVPVRDIQPRFSEEKMIIHNYNYISQNVPVRDIQPRFSEKSDNTYNYISQNVLVSRMQLRCSHQKASHITTYRMACQQTMR